MTFSWFSPQNQAGYGLSVAQQNRREGDDVRHASRSSGLLRVDVSQARVPQFTSRLAEERLRVVHVAPSRRFCRIQAEDGWVDAVGCIGPFYPRIIIFCIRPYGQFSLFLGPINSPEGWRSLPLLYSHFVFLIVRNKLYYRFMGPGAPST
jgi:hypothetical protein